jgi:hypothetical protein
MRGPFSFHIRVTLIARCHGLGHKVADLKSETPC